MESIGGEYKILKQFGGAMGHVYLVNKHSIPFPFVLKSYQDIKPHLEDLFFTEVKNWTSFGVHQNIVKTLFAEKINGKIFVAAEYVEGNEQGENRLTNYIGKNIPLHLIIKWAIQFTYGMNHCVGKGMIAHSDIKPDNILIDKDLNLKITDFGLSKSYINDDRSGGGTPMYYSPEQIFNPDKIDHRSDIYSFGIILYQLITKGVFPYQLSSNNWNQITLKELIQSHLQENVKKINHPLFEICKKCMAKDLSNRYQQFQELFKDLVIVAKNESIEIPKQIISRDDKLEELFILSCSLSAIGENKEALRAIDMYLSNQPDHYSAWTQKGRLEFELGNMQNALDATKKSIYLYQYSTAAVNNLGAIYYNLNQINEAKTCYLRAVELDPNNSGALLNLAGVLIDTENYSESAQCVIRCFELTPEKELLITKARTFISDYIKKGLLDLSLIIYSYLHKYTELTSNEIFNFAMCNYSTGKYDKAIELFKIAYKLLDGDKEIIINLSQALVFVGKYDEAVDWVELLISKKIDVLKGVTLKAQFIQRSGDHEKAFKYLMSKILEDPTNDYLWYTMGLIQEDSKNYDSALKSYITARDHKLRKGFPVNHNSIVFLNDKIEKIKKNCG